MIGYYPQREEGELLYSATARAIAISFPNSTARFAAERMLGDRDKSFGGILPNNCRRLRMNVPEIAALTDASILEGSAYPLIAPILEPAQRACLKESLFQSKSAGTRNWFCRGAAPVRHLRYCPLCAKQDALNGRPKFWRVVHHHPAVVCCDLHGRLLVTTEAQFGPGHVHDPAQWIDVEIPLPAEATGIEIAVAVDVRWLYSQRALAFPGPRALAASLRSALSEIPTYVDRCGRLRWSEILADLRAKAGDALPRLDTFWVNRRSSNNVLVEKGCCPLQRYSLLAWLVGIPLREIFDRASRPSIQVTVYQAQRKKRNREEVLQQSLQTLTGFLRQNPSVSRKQIIAIHPYATWVVRKRGRLQYEQIMPARQRRGRNSRLDWATRDQTLRANALRFVSSIASHTESVRHTLELLGLSPRLFEKAKGRLPQTEMLVRSLVASGRAKSNGNAANVVIRMKT